MASPLSLHAGMPTNAAGSEYEVCRVRIVGALQTRLDFYLAEAQDARQVSADHPNVREAQQEDTVDDQAIVNEAVQEIFAAINLARRSLIDLDVPPGFRMVFSPTLTGNALLSALEVIAACGLQVDLSLGLAARQELRGRGNLFASADELRTRVTMEKGMVVDLVRASEGQFPYLIDPAGPRLRGTDVTRMSTGGKGSRAPRRGTDVTRMSTGGKGPRAPHRGPNVMRMGTGGKGPRRRRGQS